MSSPMTEARSQTEAALVSACTGWGKVISIREAMNLTFAQQANLLGPRWAILQWQETRPEAWGPGLEGQVQELNLWLLDPVHDADRRAESEAAARARLESLTEALKASLTSLPVNAACFCLTLGPTPGPLAKLAESRETPHLALFSCQISLVWPQHIL